MKNLKQLDKAEKLALLRDIARGDLDPKQIDDDSLFAVTVKDWYIQEHDKNSHVILIGEALQAEKKAETIEFVPVTGKDPVTGDFICEPGPYKSIRVIPVNNSDDNDKGMN